MSTHGDVNPSSLDTSAAGQGQNRLVVSSVTESHSVSLHSGSQSKDLFSSRLLDGIDVLTPAIDAN